MTYDHAVLGETLELSKDAAKWFTEEKERLKTGRQAKKSWTGFAQCQKENVRCF